MTEVPERLSALGVNIGSIAQPTPESRKSGLHLRRQVPVAGAQAAAIEPEIPDDLPARILQRAVRQDHLTSRLLESRLVELQRRRVLADSSHHMLREAGRVLGLDLDANRHFGVHGVLQVVQDLV